MPERNFDKVQGELEEVDHLSATEIPTNVLLGYFLSFLLGIVGGTLGAYCGWLYDDGWYPVLACIMGFVVFFTITWFLSGPFRFHFAFFKANLRVPIGRLATTGAATFDLYVTVHRVVNRYNTDFITGLMGGDSNSYVEARVGRLVHHQCINVQSNPVKRTCCQLSGVYEECFHFSITPTDDTIRFVLWDQLIMSTAEVGQVDINIGRDILGKGFPQKKTFKLMRYNDEFAAVEAHHARSLVGNLVVSFTPGHNFPLLAGSNIEQQKPLAHEHRVSLTQQMLSKMASNPTNGTYASGPYDSFGVVGKDPERGGA